MGQKDDSSMREMGLKLTNFRRKLAYAIGQKKITQAEFGEMFGGQSPRMITSYETGTVDPPASLLFIIWKAGNSIDAIFAEGEITETGKKVARELYEQCSSVTLDQHYDDTNVERLLKDFKHGKIIQNGTIKETTAKTSGKRKTGHSPSRPSKKR